MKTLINIETKRFYEILTFLENTGWIKKDEYPKTAIDKGIDYDFYHLEKEGEMILMDWDNWDEGSIKASGMVLKELADQLRFEMRFGLSKILNLPDIESGYNDAIRKAQMKKK